MSPSLAGTKGDPAAASLGSISLAAVACAVAAGLPAASRLATAGALSWPVAASACIGLATLPVFTLGAMLRAARVGLRSIVAADERPGNAVALAGFAVAWTLVAARLGALLRAKTHHHALAGVTFALGTLAAGVALALVAARVARALGRDRTRILVGGAAVALGAAYVAISLRGGLASADASLRAYVQDASAVLLAGLVASTLPAAPRHLAKFGAPLLAAVVLTGLVLGLGSASAALAQGAPLLRAPLSAIAH